MRVELRVEKIQARKFKVQGAAGAPVRFSQIKRLWDAVECCSRLSLRMFFMDFGIKRSTVRVLALVVVYIVFLLVGAYFFSAIQDPEENEIVKNLRQARKEFLENHPCVSDDELESLIEQIISASKRGVSAVRNVTGEPNWSFGQSFFFSSTVLTTIGYGHVTPLSRAGKCFCIIYAVLGIPLTLMLLTALVERLLIPSTHFLYYLNSKLGHLFQPLNIRLIHLFIMGTILVTFFWLLPAALFDYLEPEWDYLDSIYYCFISLTTIGLGDYIPGDSPNQPYRLVYKILTSLYLLIGVTFLIFTLTVFYDIPQLNFGLFFLLEADELMPLASDLEKARLQTQKNAGPNYTQHAQGVDHAVVKVKTRSEETPSPEESLPVHVVP